MLSGYIGLGVLDVVSVWCFECGEGCLDLGAWRDVCGAVVCV